MLRYRGIPIEQLAESSHFLETAMLLLDGELPTRETLDAFMRDITYHTMVHEDVRSFYEGFRSGRTRWPSAAPSSARSPRSTPTRSTCTTNGRLKSPSTG